MKKILLAFLVLFGMTLPMIAAESSYTIEFKSNSSDASANLSYTNMQAQVEAGADYLSGYSGANVYAGINGLKFSSSKNAGTATFTLSAAGQVNATKIVVSAVKYSSDAASLAVNGSAAQTVTATLADYTYPLDGALLESIKLDATKRLYVKSITVYYDEGAASKDPAGLSFSESAYSFRLGSTWDGPVLSNPNDLDVVYTSSNEAVATVAADGTVAPLAAGSTVIKASFEGNDEFLSGEASYTLTISDAANSIAEMIEKAPAKDDIIYVNFPMTVTYANGQSVYVTDGKGGFTLLYGTNSYSELDIIPAGWEAKYSPYNGLPEFVPTSSFPTATGKGTFTPRTISLAEVNASLVNEVLIITDVLFKSATATGTTKTNFTGYDGATEVTFRNNFSNVPSVEAGKYDVKCVPGLYNSNIQVYPLSYEAIPKMTATLSFPQAAYTATIGQEFTSPAAVNPDGLALTYSSSNENVATVDTEGKVTLVAAGEAIITAAFAGDYDYEAATATYLLTVNPRIKTDVTLTWSKAEAEATVGKDFTAPTLSVTPEEAKSAVVYSSSDTAVATIDAEGNVELVGEGTATITAAITDNEYYNNATASYSLSVSPAIVQLQTTMSFSSNEASATLHHDFTAPVLTVEPKAAEALVKYSSSDEEVASVAFDGSVTLISAGTATITATIEETENFSAASASYVLTVSDEETTLSWSRDEFIAVIGEEFEAPVLTVAPEAAKALVTYSSSDESVATISAEGELTLVAAGETTITASIEAGDGYKASSASYTLTVEAPQAPTTAEVTFDFINETYDMTRLSGNTTEYNADGLVIENEEVQGKLNGNTRLWSDGLRFYKDSKITLSAPAEGNIVKVVYTSKAASSFDFAPESEDAAEATTWTGSAKEVVISCNVSKGNAAIGTLTVTYDLTSDPNKGKAELSFPEAAYSATLGQAFESPVLVNPNALEVTYESTNPEVATVDAQGSVTIVGSGITTITAVFDGNDEYNPGAASYDLTVIEGASSIADMLRLGQEDATARIAVTTPLTVTYVNGLNVYVTDGKDFTLLYGSNEYENLDIIPAGWIATYSPYGGMPEFKPASAFPAADGKGEFTPREVSLISVDAAMVNEVVIIKNVIFDEATPADKSNFTGSDGEENLAFRNNFTVASVEAGAYDVLGAIASYNDAIQVYPIEYTLLEKVTPVITFAEEELTAGIATFIKIAKPTVEPADVALTYSIEELSADAYSIEVGEDDITVMVRRAGKFTLMASAEESATVEAAEGKMTLIITPASPEILVDGEAITSTTINIPEDKSVVVTVKTVSGTEIYYAIVKDENEQPEFKLMPENGVEVNENCDMLIYAEANGVRTETKTLTFNKENGISLVFGDNIRVEGNDIIAPEGARVYDLAGRATGLRGLSAGVYVVTYGNQALKVVVK